jgi:SAM-dependent methyltransferase
MKLVRDYGDEMRILETHIREQVHDDKPLQILEAGCGREWYVKLDGVKFELTGLDIDEAALEIRKSVKRDMNHSFLGDLRTAELPPGYFDVVYNAYVLEHIKGAQAALQNFVTWLKPGGLMILRVPDRDSVQGLLARITPHWFHVFYYRWAWKMKDAGKPGFPPYPVVYDPVVSRRGLESFCTSHGLDVVDVLGVGTFRRGYGLAGRITPLVAAVVSALTLGIVHAKFVDLTVIARKRAQLV